ncbi:MAG TPA: TetR/AcrR family transcriptional regulator [Ensifer sp.]|nr:TetR/AcrR family transcriptional regulator [Ensifer sp.]
MEDVKELRHRAGRPPTLSPEERQRLILSAAEKTFLDAGYGAATMEEIAKRAGMSKKTLYQHFPDKAAVFEAMIRAMPVLPDLPLPETVSGEDLFEVLLTGLLHFGSFVLSAQQVNFTRLVIAESKRHPEVARLFGEICIDRGRRQITDFIQALQTRGMLTKAGDAGSLSDLLFGATIATVHFDELMDVASTPHVKGRIEGREALEAMIRARLEILFRGLTEGP